MLVASQVAPGKPKILHCLDQSDETRRRLHGSGRHSSIDRLTVSQPTTVEFEFTMGEVPVVTGGRLLVVWRWPFDWSDLQTTDPQGAGFMTTQVESATNVELSAKYNWIAGIEPWHHQLQVQVTAGRLSAGDRVTIVCGDPSSGGAGWRAPTCVADRCRFLMLIDHAGTGERVRLVPTPTFRVEPGDGVRLTAIADSDGVVAQPIEFLVRAEDEWGNLTQTPDSYEIQARRLGQTETIPIKSERLPRETLRAVDHWQVVFAEPGDYQLTVERDQQVAVSNGVRVQAAAPAHPLFWGDLHAGQTEIGCGCGSLADHYAFGRDCAGLKFMTHQANDHYVTQGDWQTTRDVTEDYYEPDRFVPFLGCEWSPLTKDGGDRNVFYRHDDPVLRRSDRFFIEEPPDPEPDIPTASEFHNAFHDRDVLVNIHVGGRMTNLQWYDQKIERLCETHSTHGTVEWFFMDALARGYRVGLTAGTDGVMGRPGADHPGRRLIRNTTNGLTAVYAKDLSRESLWQALTERCCYATTGERIRVWLEILDQPMGREVSSAGPVTGSFEVVGTAAIEKVELFRGVDVLQTWAVAPARANDRLRVLWGGTERKGTARLQKATWHGLLQLHGGNIAQVTPIRFQSLSDQLRLVDPHTVEWRSQTAGNSTGMELTLGGRTADAQLEFATEPFSVSRPLGDFDSEQWFDAGGVNRFVKIGPAPDPTGPLHFQTDFVDRLPIAGTQPYWIRVTQVDQALAWSSPVYVSS